MVKPVTSWLTKNYGLNFFVQINLWPEFTGFVTGYGLGSWFDDFWKSWLLYRLPVCRFFHLLVIVPVTGHPRTGRSLDDSKAAMYTCLVTSIFREGGPKSLSMQKPLFWPDFDEEV